MNVSSFLWTSAGQKADGITPTHTHVEDVNHVISSLVIRLGWHQRSSGQLHNWFDFLSEYTVGAMTVGVLPVGSMGRPQRTNMDHGMSPSYTG